MSTRGLNFNSGNVCENYGIVQCEILLHANINFFFAIQSCSSLVFYVIYSNDYYHTSLLDHLFIFKFGAIETFISNGKLPILQSSPSGSLQI